MPNLCKKINYFHKFGIHKEAKNNKQKNKMNSIKKYTGLTVRDILTALEVSGIAIIEENNFPGDEKTPPNRMECWCEVIVKDPDVAQLIEKLGWSQNPIWARRFEAAAFFYVDQSQETTLALIKDFLLNRSISTGARKCFSDRAIA